VIFFTGVKSNFKILRDFILPTETKSQTAKMGYVLLIEEQIVIKKQIDVERTFQFRSDTEPNPIPTRIALMKHDRRCVYAMYR